MIIEKRASGCAAAHLGEQTGVEYRKSRGRKRECLNDAGLK
ncbi:MAG: hypothetical protein R2875_05405 [Desulfobacterales bacterium]